LFVGLTVFKEDEFTPRASLHGVREELTRSADDPAVIVES
jgi:hypothetical protein